MMKLILHKFTKLFKLIRCRISKSYASKYYTELCHDKIQLLGENFNVGGKIIVTDWRQLVIGKNVRIGRNCTFISEGGIYIEDNSVIEDGVMMDTRTEGFQLEKLGSKTISKLKPIFITKNSVIKKGILINGTDAPKDVRIPGNGVDGSNRFFIVSTGRSGTNAIAKSLDKHPAISCKHEPMHVFNRLSTELAHGCKSREQVLFEMNFIFKNCTFMDEGKNLIGECDWKYSNLIDLIHEVFPKAKFIWLIRKPEDFVSSAYGRGWLDEYEYAYPFTSEYSKDIITDKEIFNHYRMEYSIYRISGEGVGILTAEDWKKMGAFERCCWFWNYWNDVIYQKWDKLPSELKWKVNLEELEMKKSELFRFLGLDFSDDLKILHTNKAYHEKFSEEKWNESQKLIFEKWCGDGKRKWYLSELKP